MDYPATPSHAATTSSAQALKTAADLRARWELLTYRQQQAALLVIRENLTYRQIAERLVISTHTVKEHLSAVYAHLGVRDRRDLRHQMLFTENIYALLENQPSPAQGEEEAPPPAA